MNEQLRCSVRWAPPELSIHPIPGEIIGNRFNPADRHHTWKIPCLMNVGRIGHIAILFRRISPAARREGIAMQNKVTIEVDNDPVITMELINELRDNSET